MTDSQSPEAKLVFADMYTTELHPYRVHLSFHQTQPLPPGARSGPDRKAETVAEIAMTLEHFKTSIFMQWRQMCEYERQTGIRSELPKTLLEATKIDPAEWRAFWYGEVEPAKEQQNGAKAPVPA